jgi:TrmH family RNA methyltransferase
MGTEADGLSDVWLQNTDMQVKVPMLGIADSLNVSACLAAVVYEAVRQRHSKNS